MLTFLLGLIVGAILGVFFVAILSSGAIADEQNDHLLRTLKGQEAEQNSMIAIF
jgi:hypothetical protein